MPPKLRYLQTPCTGGLLHLDEAIFGISAPRRKGDVWIELNEVFYFSARLTDQSLFTLHHVRPIILHGERWCSDDITTHAFQPIIRSVGQIARPFDCVLLQPSQPITAHTYERTSC